MRNLTNLFLMAAFSIGMVACSSDQDEPVVSNGELQIIEGTIDQLDEVTTRTTSVVNSSDPDKVSFSISNKDTLGIFTSGGGGAQLSFPLTGSGTSFAFNGGGWGLKSAYKYAAYMPFSKINYDRTSKTIPMKYIGQIQNGLNNAAHMGKFDYQACAGVTPVNDKATFKMDRQSAIIVFKLTMPVAAEIKSATISTNGHSIFIRQNNLDISGTTVNVSTTSANKSTKATLYLENCTTQANKEFRLYMMAGTPVAIGSKTLRLAVRTSTGQIYYTGNLTKYYPTDSTTDWAKNTRFCYKATLRLYTGTVPEKYIDDLVGSLDQPAVTVPDPGAWY